MTTGEHFPLKERRDRHRPAWRTIAFANPDVRGRFREMKRHTGVLCAVLFSVLWGGCSQAPRPSSESYAKGKTPTLTSKTVNVKASTKCEVAPEEIRVHYGDEVVYMNNRDDCEVWITTESEDLYAKKRNGPISKSGKNSLKVLSNPKTKSVRYLVEVHCCIPPATPTGTSESSPGDGAYALGTMTKATYVIVEPKIR